MVLYVSTREPGKKKEKRKKKTVLRRVRFELTRFPTTDRAVRPKRSAITTRPSSLCCWRISESFHLFKYIVPPKKRKKKKLKVFLDQLSCMDLHRLLVILFPKVHTYLPSLSLSSTHRPPNHATLGNNVTFIGITVLCRGRRGGSGGRGRVSKGRDIDILIYILYMYVRGIIYYTVLGPILRHIFFPDVICMWCIYSTLYLL